MTINIDELPEVLAAYKASGSIIKTAEALGKPPSWVNRRLKRSAEVGLVGSVGGEVPLGFGIHGTTTLYDGSGNITAQWVKTHREGEQQQALVDALEEVFSKYSGKSTDFKPWGGTGLTVENLLTVYPIADLHLGLYAWKPEAGESYDIKLAEKRLLDATDTLVGQAPYSKKAVILNLGDFLHSDNNENRTLKNGNPLDVDTRYARVLETGVQLLIRVVDLALRKHDEVEVRCLAGNHDPYGAIALSVALRQFYSNNERVHVDRDPSYFWHYRHGQVLLTATHGDMIKPDQMPGVVASYWPEDWGATKWRYCYLGHVHHISKGGGEQHGLVWETFQSLTAKDNWHRQSGYSSGQSMVAITHDQNKGEVQRLTVNI